MTQVTKKKTNKKPRSLYGHMSPTSLQKIIKSLSHCPMGGEFHNLERGHYGHYNVALSLSSMIVKYFLTFSLWP